MAFIQLQFRRDTAANWTLHNPTLAAGELGIETDTSQFKIGNGTLAWSALSYGGLQGPTGPTGSTGSTGPAGADGKTVLSGSVDPTTEGVNGDFYINTTAWTIFGPKTAGNWGTGSSLVGPQGAQGIQGTQGIQGVQGPAGADGKTVLSGAVDPTTEGVNGDFYINTTSWQIFGPKTAGNWGTGTDLIGSTTLDSLTDVTITTPSSGQVLKYNGSAWVNDTDSVTAPGGANTQVQFNSSGAFAGDDDFTWNSGTRTLALGAAGGQAAISAPNNLTFNGDTLFINTADSRVGINTSTPEATLAVNSQGTGNTRGILLQHVDNTTAFSHAKFIGRRSRGSHGSPSAVQADDSLAGYIAAGYKATGWSNTVGGLYIYAAENWTDSATGTYVTIRGPAPGGTTVSERARFEHLKTTFAGDVLATGAIGYTTGAGGTVTQDTSRTTGVTLNKANGAITLFSAAGSASWQSFTVTNSTVAATDVVIVNQQGGTDKYMVHVTAVAAGSFEITYATTGGTTTEQPVFNFAVIKAVTA